MKYQQIPNHGFLFALLDETGRALHTPFECKDYLQDIFYSENNRRRATIWGMSWEPGTISPELEWYYLLLRDRDINLLKKAPSMLKFLHYFEDAQGFQKSSILVYDDDPHTVVLKFSGEWTKNSGILSTFSTCIRLSGPYKVSSGDPMEFLRATYRDYRKSGKISPEYSEVDYERLPRFFSRLLAFSRGYKVPGTWEDTPNVQSAHDHGIIYYPDYPVADFKMQEEGGFPETVEIL